MKFSELLKQKECLYRSILKFQFTCGYWVPIRVNVCKAWVCNVLVNGFTTFICAGSNKQPIRMGTKSCKTNRPMRRLIINSVHNKSLHGMNTKIVLQFSASASAVKASTQLMDSMVINNCCCDSIRRDVGLHRCATIFGASA